MIFGIQNKSKLSLKHILEMIKEIYIMQHWSWKNFASWQATTKTSIDFCIDLHAKEMWFNDGSSSSVKETQQRKNRLWLVYQV